RPARDGRGGDGPEAERGAGPEAERTAGPEADGATGPEADGAADPEALLLRRNRSSGFVPGAYVFPGGRVDEADTDPRLVELADGLAPDATPEPAYWMAAVREAFEETGVLLARRVDDGEPAPDAAADATVRRWREKLLEEEATLHDVLEAMSLRLALDEVVRCAHWITPVAERRRYDTHFFAARCPAGREVSHDAREMTDAVWLSPDTAIDRFRAGRLPMVFPTVKTLESLAAFGSVSDALGAFRERDIEPILPRLVRTDGGVGIVVD
ncbi:MAG: NUDIX hydrolase, partial [Gemmatimonadota bacterium]